MRGMGWMSHTGKQQIENVYIYILDDISIWDIYINKSYSYIDISSIHDTMHSISEDSAVNRGEWATL